VTNKINELKEKIYEIENFISDKEIDQIFSIVNLESDEGWGTDNTGFKIDRSEIMFMLEQKIMTQFANATRCVSLQDVKRLKVGEIIGKHHDQSTPDTMWGAIIYLNDNYSGGEIDYPDLNFMVKPKKGSMIVHSATFLHHVLPVIEGTRYMITTFIFGDETTKLIIE
jgi:hypothetical protein